MSAIFIEELAFAERLKNALEQAGVSTERGVLQRIADQLDVSHTAARKWLHGEQLPNNRRILQLARWLRVNVVWLASGEGKPDALELSDDEEALVKAYRLADVKGKTTINAVAEVQLRHNHAT